MESWKFEEKKLESKQCLDYMKLSKGRSLIVYIIVCHLNSYEKNIN
jgi:hypothetical protein